MRTDQTHHPYTLAYDMQPIDFLDENKTSTGELLERCLNALRRTDRNLGRLFAALRCRNLADDTIVVTTGDQRSLWGDRMNRLSDMAGVVRGKYSRSVDLGMRDCSPPSSAAIVQADISDPSDAGSHAGIFIHRIQGEAPV